MKKDKGAINSKPPFTVVLFPHCALLVPKAKQTAMLGT